MSSLAAARADGFYYPTDFNAKRDGTLNKFQKSHALGKRAKLLASDGILIIRFEMPFKVICLQCNSIIAKGVRYNAEKKCVGKYLSSKIWEFSMNCYVCKNQMVITTDPKNGEYLCTRGLRLKVETFEPESTETFRLDSTETKARAANDAMFRLEKNMLSTKTMESVGDGIVSGKGLGSVSDEDTGSVLLAQREKRSLGNLEKASKVAGKGELSRIRQLYELNSNSSKDSYSANYLVRERFREKKKQEISKEKEESAIKNFAIPIVKNPFYDELERRAAKMVKFRRDNPRIKSLKAREALLKSSIFLKKSSTKKPNSRVKKITS